jgi:hypothetical protein
MTLVDYCFHPQSVSPPNSPRTSGCGLGPRLCLASSQPRKSTPSKFYPSFSEHLEDTGCSHFSLPAKAGRIWLFEASLVSAVLNSVFFFFFFFGETGVWTQGFTLANPTTWVAPPVYCPGYSGDEIWSAICLDCPWTIILLISASQVARITGMSHCAQLWIHFKVAPVVKIE